MVRVDSVDRAARPPQPKTSRGAFSWVRACRIFALSYVPAAYLYWLVVMGLGELFFGGVQFAPWIPLPANGYQSFGWVVGLSPFTVPIDLLGGLWSFNQCRLSFAQGGPTASLWNLGFMLGSFAIALGLAYAILASAWWAVRKVFRRAA
jgi:hypothetical protein